MMKIRVEGLDRLARKSKRKRLGGPLRRFFKRTALRLVGAAKLRAPRDLGRLHNSLAEDLDPAPIPMWARVGTNVRHHGISYPKRLDRGNFRYRGGGAMGLSGQPTKGWFTDHAVEDMRADMRDYVRDLGKDIKGGWKRS